MTNQFKVLKWARAERVWKEWDPHYRVCSPFHHLALSERHQDASPHPLYLWLSYCLEVFRLVAALHCSWCIFLSLSVLVVQHQRVFCVWLCPKGSFLAKRFIITQYTTLGKTIPTSLMANMRGNKIKKERLMMRKGSWKTVSVFLLVFPLIVAVAMY